MSCSVLEKALIDNNWEGVDLLLKQGTRVKEIKITTIKEINHYSIWNSVQTEHIVTYYTPLVYSCRQGNVETTKVLVENGTNVNECDQQNDFPILICARDDRIECLKLLVAQNSADVNVKDSEGRTALQVAIEASHIGVVRLLCSQPCTDLMVANKEGKTPIQVAKSVEVLEIIDEALNKRNNYKHAEESADNVFAQKLAFKRKIEDDIKDFQHEVIKSKIRATEHKVTQLDGDIEKLDTNLVALDEKEKVISEKIKNLNNEKPALEREVKIHMAEKGKMIEDRKTKEERDKWKECPICTEIMEQTIYQCTEGHCFCGECRVKIEECPICRCDVTNASRCRVLERIINEGKI